MRGFEDHKVVTSKILSDWLYDVASDHGESVWTGDAADYMTLTKADIVNEVWATYSTDEDTTGIYITGYSVGDGKSEYTDTQNIIAADIAYREASAAPSDYVFRVYAKDDPKTNAGYVNNVLDDQVTFQVVCSDQGTITVTKSDQTDQLVTPQTVTFVEQNDQGLYVYEFNVKRNDTQKQTTGDYPNYFSVSHSEYDESLPIVVWIGDMSIDIYTNMKYYYTIGNSGSDTNTYDDVASVNYSFKIPSSNINPGQIVTFSDRATGNRVSNRPTPPGGYGEYDNKLKDYTFSAPFTFNINVGKRNFYPTSAVTIGQTDEDKILQDCTILFTNSTTPSGSQSYPDSYSYYFPCNGVEISNITLKNTQLYAKIASNSTNNATVTADIERLSIRKEEGEWSEHYGFVDNPNMTLRVNTLPQDHIKFKFQGQDFTNAHVVAYKSDSSEGTTNMILFVDFRDPDTGGTYGYTRFAFNIGDTITGTVDGQETTFEVGRKTYDAYDQRTVYIIIPNYSDASTYEINIPTINGQSVAYKTWELDERWCPLTYQFGSGIKCSNLETITTRLWNDIDLYENVNQIRLCEIRVRDGIVPKFTVYAYDETQQKRVEVNENYISYVPAGRDGQYKHYMICVSDQDNNEGNKSKLIRDLNHDNPIIIRVSGEYDPSAKEYSWVGDDFPPILIDDTPEEE